MSNESSHRECCILSVNVCQGGMTVGVGESGQLQSLGFLPQEPYAMPTISVHPDSGLTLGEMTGEA